MKIKIVLLVLVLLAVFLGWRFIRPMNIFIVSGDFERPISTIDAPVSLGALRADECATCHRDFYTEWQTTIHSQAWTDPYFQVDWQFDGAQQICKNCHIPLDRQQEHKVLGFRDKAKWDPILAPNPDFDPRLQHEGVTCAVCHLREGKIMGVYGGADSPHPVKKIDDPNDMCIHCHVVEGDRWDTFFRFPPCGTVAEIQANPQSQMTHDEPDAQGGEPATGLPKGYTGEVAVPEGTSLGCVQCHMPLVERPLVEGGKPRPVRQHLWRGGHDPDMVKQGIELSLENAPGASGNARTVILTLTNVGAAHYLPTGTPDRHLTVELRLLDASGQVLKEDRHTLVRTIMWRPFIVDLWDTRLPRWQPRVYEFSFSVGGKHAPVAVEAVVRYHLLAEKRRKRIGYENKEPIAYEVFRQKLFLTGS